MSSFISSQFLLYVSMGIILFVPGYFLIVATSLNKKMSPIETFVVSCGASIAISDFLIILLGKSPFRITDFSIFSAIILFNLVCFIIYLIRNRKKTTAVAVEEIKPSDKFPLKSAAMILLIIFLMIFIKTIYFKDTIFPATTDLGHHMYWAKQITLTHDLPFYSESEIGQDLTIEKPRPIADFIIGEHLIFAAIALLSKAEFISAFPALVLFLVQIMSLLAIFILTREIFKKAEHGYADAIALMALFLIGPLYALSSPQAKFVSGGVIGNTIGNLLIPLVLYFFIRAFSEKKSLFLSWALFISLGLAYTHHLSTFILLFIFLFALIIFIIFNFRIISKEFLALLKLFISPYTISFLVFGLIFIFFIYTPTYLNPQAIDTAVGTPSKATRTGLSWEQLKTTVGEARFVFALAGLILLFFTRKMGKYRQAFLIGWVIALAVMSLRPDWLFVDIPSNRIASYTIFPAAIAGACLLVHIFIFLKNGIGNTNKNYLSPAFVLITFFTFLAFVAANGFFDNSQSLNKEGNAGKALQTYAASQYLVENSGPQDTILKDHNYLSGDAWIKLFFMRDYNFPLSRGYFKRYEDSPSREQCTNLMISAPGSPNAKKCFEGTKTDFVMVNPQMDSGQFIKLKNFWQIYSSDEAGIYYRIK